MTRASISLRKKMDRRINSGNDVDGPDDGDGFRKALNPLCAAFA
jgi:hypothetical protein